MKVLLTAVNAKYIHSNPAVYSLQKFVTAYAPEYGRNVELAEFTINHYADDILQEIYRRRPDVVAFSCYIWNLQMIERVLEDLPRVLPEVQIWAGGPEVSYDAPEFLKKHDCMTGVMMGEGEETFLELMEYWHGKKKLNEIPGITWRDGEGEIKVQPGRPLLDMNRIPFLYDELDDFEHRIIYYESSRGCPFSCSYCLSSIDKSVRFRDAQTVVKELQFFLDRKVPQVKFVDRTFNCRHSHALTIWNYIREHDNGITNFHFEIAADLLNEEELALLNTMRPGLVQLEIGVQSTNQKTIEAIDRVMDFSHLCSVVKRVQSGHNIHQHLDLIAGLPWENFDSFRQSFNDVYHLYPDQLQLGFLKVLKGSRMQEKAEEYGIVYHSDPVYEVFYTNWISYQEILELKQIEDMVEVYYNSGQFPNTIRHLEKEFSDPFTMYQRMAAFYGQQGWWGQSHSRMQRFEMLREFIHSISENGIYDELLLLDLYLRENSKSRPKWAPDLQNEKKQFLDWFRQEEQEHQVLKGYEGFSARQMMNMVHLERFSIETAQLCGWEQQKEDTQECWVLFDYRNRNALDQNAGIYFIKSSLASL
ncbi:coproporphyrinogen III oxidase [uncultured Clostridium sp.]|uniref:B12-binding domain-containing radical SAM protein n=1 Tax=Muricoprocola aceti TaxID=2981772 RepID=A0ABT2SI70_9FIRM|nr:B12-binding domain-containing radical SAM protein [Muricoprocola aceti]MCU6724209.1 B12-binding domain-containing radical SAM protein [Muricoprocola aceti]SCH06184.1 coproporphyrinogen III oxidase [uncultured Clostridium sp.]